MIVDHVVGLDKLRRKIKKSCRQSGHSAADDDLMELPVQEPLSALRRDGQRTERSDGGFHEVS